MTDSEKYLGPAVRAIADAVRRGDDAELVRAGVEFTHPQTGATMSAVEVRNAYATPPKRRHSNGPYHRRNPK